MLTPTPKTYYTTFSLFPRTDLGNRLVGWSEVEGTGVYAVVITGGVIVDAGEEMAEMAATVCAGHFGALHAK